MISEKDDAGEMFNKTNKMKDERAKENFGIMLKLELESYYSKVEVTEWKNWLPFTIL
jgi:hypothetical protein